MCIHIHTPSLCVYICIYILKQELVFISSPSPPLSQLCYGLLPAPQHLLIPVYDSERQVLVVHAVFSYFLNPSVQISGLLTCTLVRNKFFVWNILL